MSLPVIMTFLPVCPHCGKEDMTFYLFRVVPIDQDKALSFWQCGHCKKGVCGKSSHIPERSHIFEFSNFIELYPNPKPIEAPAHMPDFIAPLYCEAVSSLRVKNCTAAAMVIRKSIEESVKMLGGQGGNLKFKIQDLANRNIITVALAEWAHEVRLIGNEAAHDTFVPAEKDVQQAIYFAEMFFTYVYTLPGMVAERRKKDV